MWWDFLKSCVGLAINIGPLACWKEGSYKIYPVSYLSVRQLVHYLCIFLGIGPLVFSGFLHEVDKQKKVIFGEKSRLAQIWQKGPKMDFFNNFWKQPKNEHDIIRNHCTVTYGKILILDIIKGVKNSRPIRSLDS